ncbi:MAG: Unknown protein [uncultured Sulfurovum sp.]|uniref:Uncharacterized protein n=1 Tax=uncultured Sulfurovum sp. TaxID=269237 RepID=A0A6S6SKH9_9BACT|nr:MAG: Unknown protein [uncultured Sulfurovum sp.]
MTTKKDNPKHWNLCPIKEVAQFTGFTEQNIRDRYKKVEGKENLYNAMQVMTYLNKESITMEELVLLVEMYLGTTLKSKLLIEMINRNWVD